MAGIDPAINVSLQSDVNGQGDIGLEEVIYILQTLSGLRN